MKFCSSWKINAPCKPDGEDCPKRTLGCHSKCKDFVDYKERLLAYKRGIYERKRKESLVDEFVAKSQIMFTDGKKYER